MGGMREVRGLTQKLADAGQELAADAGGQEAVITDVAEVAVGDVRNEASEKLQDGEGHGCGSIGVMVQIFESDGGAIIGFDAGFAEWRALEIFAEIFDSGLAVIGLFVEMDDPGFMIEDVEPGVEGGIGMEMAKGWGKLQTAGLEFGAEEVDNGITPHAFERFVREIDVGHPGGAILGKSSGSGGQMDVAVAFEIAAKGV